MLSQFFTAPVLYREIRLNQHFSQSAPMVAISPQLGHKPLFLRVIWVFLVLSHRRFLHLLQFFFSSVFNGLPQCTQRLLACRFSLIALLFCFLLPAHLEQNNILPKMGAPQSIQRLSLILFFCAILYFVIKNIFFVGEQSVFKGLSHFLFSKYASIALRISSAFFNPVCFARTFNRSICLLVRYVSIRFMPLIYTPFMCMPTIILRKDADSPVT